MAAISPTGTGKTLSYLLPMFTALRAPSASTTVNAGSGVRAVIVAPTRELAHQIHNECLKLAQGRKWRIVLFSKATAATLADRSVQDKIGAGSTRQQVTVTYRLYTQILLSARRCGS
jgi:ATP-dependent RNA helicase DDX52/ROK1